MPRVFLGLAAGHLIVLLATLATALAFDADRTELHVLLAVFALLLTVLIQAVAFTYFTATNKMMNQAVALARLSTDPIVRTLQAKRRFTRMLACLVILVVAATATGADNWRMGRSSDVHLVLGFAVFAAHVLVYLGQYRCIVLNSAAVRDVMTAYAAFRAAQKQSAAAGVSHAPPAAGKPGLR